jgi:hypothetical protein
MGVKTARRSSLNKVRDSRRISDGLSTEEYTELKKQFGSFVAQNRRDIKKVSLGDRDIDGTRTFFEFNTYYVDNELSNQTIEEIKDYYENVASTYGEYLNYRNTKIQEMSYSEEDEVLNDLIVEFSEYLQGRYDDNTLRDFLLQAVVYGGTEGIDAFEKKLFAALGVQNSEEIEDYFATNPKNVQSKFEIGDSVEYQQNSHTIIAEITDKEFGWEGWVYAIEGVDESGDYWKVELMSGGVSEKKLKPQIPVSDSRKVKDGLEYNYIYELDDMINEKPIDEVIKMLGDDWTLSRDFTDDSVIGKPWQTWYYEFVSGDTKQDGDEEYLILGTMNKGGRVFYVSTNCNQPRFVRPHRLSDSRRVKDSLGEDEYEEYLNELGEGLDEDEFIMGGESRLGMPYGTAMRQYDPIAFNVGYDEWVRENEDDDDEYKLEQIADLLEEGYRSGYDPQWDLDVTVDGQDISEFNDDDKDLIYQDIAYVVKDGYDNYQGIETELSDGSIVYVDFTLNY